jgi:DNA (cytosine-5)-methyltransferase 1
MTIGALFAGIGGLELGLERAGLGPVSWHVEIDPTARSVLARHWPEARALSDVRTVRPEDLDPVHLICGGFPCQDLSSANVRGKQGLNGAKSASAAEASRAAGAAASDRIAAAVLDAIEAEIERSER